MPGLFRRGSASHVLESAGSRRHHRELMRRTLFHLMLIYLAPFLALTIYFHVQSLHAQDEARRRQLQSVAEYQSHMLDLFIRERAVNLSNLIQDPYLEVFPSHTTMERYLQSLRQDSDSFVDVGVFDATGVQVAWYCLNEGWA